MDHKQLAAQLRKPQGEPGRQVGEVMNKGNLLINQWAIEALKLAPNDAVLEIGMGNGAFVKNILQADSTITYHGIDYSDTMVEEATMLNEQWLKEGRASFSTEAAHHLPFEASSFSKILSVNTIYFWDDAQAELQEINRVLKEEGLAVFAIRTKNTMNQMPFTEFGFRKFDLNELGSLLEQHFTVLRLFKRTEPSYTFKEQTITLENGFAICSKK